MGSTGAVGCMNYDVCGRCGAVITLLLMWRKKFGVKSSLGTVSYRARTDVMYEDLALYGL